MDSVNPVVDHSYRVWVSLVGVGANKVSVRGRSDVDVFDFIFHSFSSYAHSKAFMMCRTG